MERRLACAICDLLAESEAALDSHIEEEHSFIWRKSDPFSFCQDISSSVEFGSYLLSWIILGSNVEAHSLIRFLDWALFSDSFGRSTLPIFLGELKKANEWDGKWDKLFALLQQIKMCSEEVEMISAFCSFTVNKNWFEGKVPASKWLGSFQRSPPKTRPFRRRQRRPTTSRRPKMAPRKSRTSARSATRRLPGRHRSR